MYCPPAFAESGPEVLAVLIPANPLGLLVTVGAEPAAIPEHAARLDAIMLREVEPYAFEVTGQAKQNVKGGQMVAVNLFNEANGKVRVVVDEMRRRLSIQSSVDRPAIPPRQVTKTADYMLAILIVTIFGLVVLAFTLMA